MTSEQKYEGKGNNTQPNEQTVKNEGQTAPQTDSTAQDATTPPSEQVDALPTAADPAPSISAQTVGNDEQPLLVPLTDYFRKVTASRANVTAFRDMLHTVLIHYATSEEFRHRATAESDNQISVLHSLNAGIAMFVERTADYRLGARQRDPGPLPGEAEQPDPVVDPAAYVLYGGDLQAITDVDTLRGWVTALQTERAVLVRQYEDEIDSLAGQLHGLGETLKLERDELAIASQRITELQSRPFTPRPVAPKKTSPQYTLTVHLDLGRSTRSVCEVKLVQHALKESYDSMMLASFNSIAEGEYANAHSYFNDAQAILGLLNEMSMDLVDVAANNLAVAVGYSDTPEDEGFGDFMKEYLPGVSA